MWFVNVQIELLLLSTISRFASFRSGFRSSKSNKEKKNYRVGLTYKLIII